jgi:TonB family protein
MNVITTLLSLSAKVALLGGIAWLQLYLLRRAPASTRSRLCAVAMVAILLLGTGELLAPNWMVKAPVYQFTAAATAGTSPAARLFPIGSALALIWMAGAGLMLLRAAIGRTAIAMIRRRSTLLEHAGEVEVRIADVQTPILAGMLRPVILLPVAAQAWTGEQRRMVLTHELTHFRQGDIWTNLLAQMLRAAFWFHPVVWLLVSRLSREQELACDEAVVASGHSRHDYAAFLLEAVRDLRSREMFVCSMAGSGARSLKLRFSSLLDPTPRRALTRRLAMSLASFALVAITLTAVRPVWSQAQSEKQAQGERKVYKMGEGITPPTVLTRVQPEYTEEAKANKVAGTVMLKTVITAEGVPDQIQVVKGIGAGLDEKAVEALSNWTFQPATKDGAPVAVWATVEVNFKLK